MPMKHEFKENVLDALVAAALLPGLTTEHPNEEEIDRIISLCNSITPTDEDLEVTELVTQKIEAAIQGRPAPVTSSRNHTAFMLAAMNRKNQEERFSEQTEQGLDEARRSALEQLRKEQERGDTDDL